MSRELLNVLGIRPGKRCRKDPAQSERGVTLVETLVAALVLIIVVVGLLPVFVFGIQTTNTQGDVATRTTEYAQDKMEQLLSLDKINLTSDGFNDGVADTTQFPTAINGVNGAVSTCTGAAGFICGLGGTMAASSSIGSIPPAAPVTFFVDYLDINGNLLTSSTGAYYTRQWKVDTDSTATMKTITIVASSLQAVGVKGIAPSATLVCVKASKL
jgi:type II secretory pathway pseudopilin PulG